MLTISIAEYLKILAHQSLIFPPEFQDPYHSPVFILVQLGFFTAPVFITVFTTTTTTI